MRISDWSSDVCSSDLAAGQLYGHQGLAVRDEIDAHADAGRVAAHPRCLEAGRRGPALEAPGNRLSKQGLAPATVAMDPPDRKSVVQGKSVAVSVRIGGCRMIKKTKN